MSVIRVPGISEPKRRIKSLLISPEVLLEWFKGMSRPRTFSASGMPADAELVGATFDAERRLFRLYVASESFPEIYPGGVPLEMELLFTEHVEEVAVHR